MDYIGTLISGAIAVLATAYVGFMRNRPVTMSLDEAKAKILDLESEVVTNQRLAATLQHRLVEAHQRLDNAEIARLRGTKVFSPTVSPEKQDAEVFVTRLGPQDATDAEWKRTTPQGQLVAHEEAVAMQIKTAMATPALRLRSRP